MIRKIWVQFTDWTCFILVGKFRRLYSVAFSLGSRSSVLPDFRCTFAWVIPSYKAVHAEDCVQWGWGNVVSLMKPAPTSQGLWTAPHTGQKPLCWADSWCWAVLEIVCWHLVLSYSPMEAVEEAVTTAVQVSSCSCRQLRIAQNCHRVQLIVRGAQKLYEGHFCFTVFSSY